MTNKLSAEKFVKKSFPDAVCVIDGDCNIKAGNRVLAKGKTEDMAWQFAQMVIANDKYPVMSPISLDSLVRGRV